jgi:hypothetical protein
MKQQPATPIVLCSNPGGARFKSRLMVVQLGLLQEIANIDPRFWQDGFLPRIQRSYRIIK